jgi:TRAP-type C4-dicarboxylate transport system permease small subunit
MQIIYKVVRALGIGTMIFIVGMMLLMTADVFDRAIFNKVIIGSSEIVEILMALLVIGFAWCALHERHVKVELLVQHLSPRIRSIFDSFNWILTLGFCILIAWVNILEAISTKQLGTATAFLEIPKYPFYFVISLGYALLGVVVAYQLIGLIRKAIKG